MLSNGLWVDQSTPYALLCQNPWFVTGFTDGDGSFSIGVKERKNNPNGWLPSLIYTFTLLGTEENIEMLKQFKTFFKGHGYQSEKGPYIIFAIEDQKGLKLVQEHFIKYPLQSIKHVYFERWSQALEIILSGEHLTPKGQHKIVSQKSGFPQGLSDKIREAFPTVSENPITYDPKTNDQNGHWIAGFTAADGSFSQGIRRIHGMRQGKTGQPSFSITQHIRDIVLQERIIDSFGIGVIISGVNAEFIQIQDQTFIGQKQIPFFNEFPQHGTKKQDFESWVEGYKIMQKKGHLTEEGQEKQEKQAKGMNSRRISPRQENQIISPKPISKYTAINDLRSFEW